MNRTLLIRYLAGECSHNEKMHVIEWLEKSPENQRMLEELDFLWTASKKNIEEVETEFNFDIEGDWKNLSHRIERYESEFAESDCTSNRSLRNCEPGGYRPSGPPRLTQFLRVAAILLIASLAGFFAWQNVVTQSVEIDEPVLREIVMNKGQRSNMVLSDGTNMTINADSKLLLPESFHSDKREVFLLDGEVYFEVAHDADKPFLIHSGGAVVQVLGTSFSVRSYPEDEEVRVVVKDGKVSLGAEDDENSSINLTASEIGHYNPQSRHVTSGKVDNIELFLSWTEGYLIFEEAPLKEVVKELERRYNVNMDFSDPKFGEMKLTAELQGREIHNVLNVISAALEIDYYQTALNEFAFTAREGD